MPNNFSILFTILSLFVLVFNFPGSYAETEPVFITLSNKMNLIEFDGKWSFFSEWKESSLNSIGESVKIRSAHYENFVYIFVDALYDSNLDKGSDRAMICFDPDNSKSIIPNENHMCFLAILDRDIGFTIQGNSPLPSKNYFNTIPNHPDFIAIGGVSDENDRYLKSPHPSYEFKIPVELISPSNHYGFYVEVFDASSGASMTWPQNIIKKNPMYIPSPNYWGELISIDKSIPEFPFPIILLVIMLFTMIIMSRKLNYGRLRINIQ